MADIIKKVGRAVKELATDPLSIKKTRRGLKKMVSGAKCRQQGGKWVGGKCQGLGKVRTGKGEKKDWYPEKKAKSTAGPTKKRKSSIKYKRKGNRESL